VNGHTEAMFYLLLGIGFLILALFTDERSAR
jgi:hypothetical protein